MTDRLLHTWQGGRGQPMLAPETVPIDARNEAELLHYLADIAAALKFDDGTESTANWRDFLDGDPLFLMAEIAGHVRDRTYFDHRGNPDELGPLQTGLLRSFEEWKVRCQRQSNHTLQAEISIAARNALRITRPATLPRQDRTPLKGMAPVSVPSMQEISAADRAIRALGEEVAEELRHAMASRSDHAPHIGLLLAFLRMRETVRAHVNALPEAHLSFFYNRVLGLSPRSATMDQTVLALSLVADTAPFVLPAGTQFEAGQVEGDGPVRYATDSDVHLDHAQVTRAISVTLDLDDTQNCRDLRFQDQSLPLTQPMLPFGGRDMGHPMACGLVISSPLLVLPGGHRRIIVTLDLSATSDDLLAAFATAGSEGIPAQSLGLQISLSGADGAQVTPASRVRLKQENQVEISCTLAPTAAAVVSAPDPLGRADGGRMDIRLARTAMGHGLSIFGVLKIASLSLSVTVDDLPLDSLGTPDGLVNAAEPFAPFGMQPLNGAAVEIALPGGIALPVTVAKLTLTWTQLPSGKGGLEDHYAGYGLGIRNDSFLVRAGAVHGGWLQEAGPDTQLFRPERGPISAQSHFELPIGKLTEAQTWRLRLVAPETGFGREVHPALLAASTAKAALPKPLVAAIASRARATLGKVIPSAAPQDAPIPKPPYTPMASEATLSYTASARIDRRDDARWGSYFAATPLGDIPAWSRGSLALAELPGAASPTSAGVFVLGVANLSNRRRLDLNVDIESRTVRVRRPSNGAPPPHLDWSYLTARGWAKLPNRNILHDGTHGFTTAGILSLQVPFDAVEDAPDMPTGQVWLAAQPTKQTPVKTIGALRSIMANAVSVTRITEAPWANVPKGRITRLTDADQTHLIQSAVQPSKGHGGRRAETKSSFDIRVSERLRHKSRALQARDYEQITLAEFDHIGDARLIRVAPGELTLAVAGRRGSPGTLPRVAPEQLSEIADHLRQRMPGNVSLSVRSIRYETVRARLWFGFDERVGTSVLDLATRAIDDWIAPWLWDPTAPCPIGAGSLDPSDLGSRIEGLAGITYTTGIALSRVSASGGPEEDAESHTYHALSSSAEFSVGTVRPSAPFSVLVPAKAHLVTPLFPPFGVSEMEIGSSLVVHHPNTEKDDNIDIKTTPFGVGALRIGQDLIPRPNRGPGDE